MANNEVKLIITTDASGAVTGIKTAEGAFVKMEQTANRSADSISSGMQSTGKSIDAIKSKTFDAGTTFNQVFGAITLASVGMMVHKTIDASLAMERMNSTMNASVGSSTLAAREMQYVKEQSERLGLDLVSTSLAFGKFTASTRNTTVEGEQTRKIFVGVSEAVTALRLPTETANGIFLALSQMMSKGKISAEELSGQLGERLPGAVKLTADAMGLTTAQLLKQMEKGELMSSDVLPKLAGQLHKTYGQAAAEAAKEGQAAINRFSNAAFESKAAIGDSLMPVLVDVLDLFRSASPIITSFVGTFKFMVVDVASGAEKLMVYMKDLKSVAIAGAVGGPIAGAAAGIAKIVTGLSSTSKTELAEIDRRAEWTKNSIVASMNKGVSSVKTTMEKAAEDAKTAAAKAVEDAAKAAETCKAAQEKAAKEAVKTREQAEKEIETYLTKTTMTELEQIEEKAARYTKAGVNKTRIAQYTEAAISEIETKEAEKQLKIWRSGQDKYENIMADEADFASTENERAINKIISQENKKYMTLYDLYETSGITYEQCMSAINQIHANSVKAQLDREVESNKKVADAKYDMLKDIKGYETEAYLLRLQQIEAEKNKRILDAGNTADAVVLASRRAEDEQKKAYIAIMGKSNDWKAGVLAGLLEITQAHTTWGGTAQAITQSFANSAGQQLQTNLFALWKGNMSGIQVDWQSMLDTFGQTLTKKISDMMIETTAQGAINIMFKTSWTEDGTNALGIINKVLGFTGDLFSSSSPGNNDMTDMGIFFDNDSGFAYGGWVPGIAAVSGNSYRNDKIRAWLSPKEYVVDRETTAEIARQGRGGDTMIAHINEAEARLLMALGGAGTINPKTGLPEFSTAESAAWDKYSQIMAAITCGKLKPSDFPIRIYGPASSSGKYSTQAWAEYLWPDINSPVTQNIKRTDTIQDQGSSLLGGLIGEDAAQVVSWAGKALATTYGGPIGAMIATAAGQVAGNVIQGNEINWGNIAKDTTMTGALAYAMQGLGEMLPKVGADATWYERLFIKATAGGIKSLTSTGIKAALASILGGTADVGGRMKVSYEGADDHGLLVSLAKTMKSMEGEGDFSINPFAGIRRAHNGYSPAKSLLADNEMPVVIEDDETILTSGHMGAVWTKLNQITALSAGQGDNREILYQIAKNTSKMAKILERFDDYGLPAERDLV